MTVPLVRRWLGCDTGVVQLSLRSGISRLLPGLGPASALLFDIDLATLFVSTYGAGGGIWSVAMRSSLAPTPRQLLPRGTANNCTDPSVDRVSLALSTDRRKLIV